MGISTKWPFSIPNCLNLPDGIAKQYLRRKRCFSEGSRNMFRVSEISQSYFFHIWVGSYLQILQNLKIWISWISIYWILWISWTEIACGHFNIIIPALQAETDNPVQGTHEGGFGEWRLGLNQQQMKKPSDVYNIYIYMWIWYVTIFGQYVNDDIIWLMIGH